MFNNNHQPHFVEADSFKEPDTNLIRFLRGLGNASEFGVWFSCGLTTAFIARLIPQMLPAYALLQVGVIAYLWAARSNHQEPLIISLALGLAIIGAFWDFVWQLLQLLISATNPLTWFGVGLSLFALLGLFLTRQRRER